MGKIIVLGSANAVAGLEQENTHLLFTAGERVVLVDCGSSPIPRLRRLGVDPLRLTDLILTHFHPDHVAGAPLLLMDLWLLGRREPLHVYGLADVTDRLQAMMDLYNWKRWPDFYPVVFHVLPAEEMTPVVADEALSVWASPVRHLIPTVGLRVQFHASGKAAAYSCDTEPCPAVVGLASGAQLLLHESAGQQTGHSSPAQAGEIARKAGVEALYLIHYDTTLEEAELTAAAAETFGKPVQLAKDFMEFEL